MGDFKINEKTLFSQSGSAEPSMGSTITDIPAAGVTGVLPSTVTLKPSSIKTVTNSYDYIKGGELKSLGYLQHNFLGCSYYLSAAQSIPHNAWTEVVGGTWTKHASSGSSGSDDSDMFGKFSGGRWTPTVSGYYHVSAQAGTSYMDEGEWINLALRRNGSGENYDVVAYVNLRSAASDLDLVCLCSGIMGLDTNDYVSLWIHQGEGSAQNLNTGVCKFSVTYVGSSDL